MATVDECRAALSELTKDIAGSGKKVDFDRTLSATLNDLDVILSGSFRDGALTDIEQTADSAADIRMRLDSDDLVAMCTGDLNVMKAMATGRLKLDASLGDMMKLRSLLK